MCRTLRSVTLTHDVSQRVPEASTVGVSDPLLSSSEATSPFCTSGVGLLTVVTIVVPFGVTTVVAGAAAAYAAEPAAGTVNSAAARATNTPSIRRFAITFLLVNVIAIAVGFTVAEGCGISVASALRRLHGTGWNAPP